MLNIDSQTITLILHKKFTLNSGCVSYLQKNSQYTNKQQITIFYNQAPDFPVNLFFL
jgi:hypothetical protein